MKKRQSTPPPFINTNHGWKAFEEKSIPTTYFSAIHSMTPTGPTKQAQIPSKYQRASLPIDSTVPLSLRPPTRITQHRCDPFDNPTMRHTAFRYGGPGRYSQYLGLLHSAQQYNTYLPKVYLCLCARVPVSWHSNPGDPWAACTALTMDQIMARYEVGVLWLTQRYIVSLTLWNHMCFRHAFQ